MYIIVYLLFLYHNGWQYFWQGQPMFAMQARLTGAWPGAGGDGK